MREIDQYVHGNNNKNQITSPQVVAFDDSELSLLEEESKGGPSCGPIPFLDLGLLTT